MIDYRLPPQSSLSVQPCLFAVTKFDYFNFVFASSLVTLSLISLTGHTLFKGSVNVCFSLIKLVNHPIWRHLVSF